ncbi:MAG: YajQ family cyclic di-GMP-binding protein [Thermoflexibacter sp.]
MASFDIVNKIDHQTLDNAINTSKKEITTRFDFKDSKTEIELDKKNLIVHITTENDLRMKAAVKVIIERMVKQGLDAKSLDLSQEEYQSGAVLKKEIPIKEGLDKEIAKKIVKEIKDLNLKVQSAIMDDQVRVTGKKIDDLQKVIAFCRQRQEAWGIPLQFVNMKS